MPAPSTDLDFADIQADTTRWEGRINHMYLDTVGKVTVGVGKMLPNVAAAQALAFVRRADGGAASADEIGRDFQAVSAQPKAMLAASYRKFTQLDLPDPEIDALLKTVVDGFQAELVKRFNGYAGYPAPAKRALLDMIYNLGPGGLGAFVRLRTAIEAGNWDAAASECQRNGISQARNDWTRDLFLQCKG